MTYTRAFIRVNIIYLGTYLEVHEWQLTLFVSEQIRWLPVGFHLNEDWWNESDLLAHHWSLMRKKKLFLKFFKTCLKSYCFSNGGAPNVRIFFKKNPSLGFIFVMSRYIHYTDSIFTKLFLSIFRWKEYNFFRIRLYHQHLLASIWDWHSDVEHQGHSSQIGNCVT